MSLDTSLNSRITRNIAIVFIYVFISKVVGALKEFAIAWRYGISETVDAYLFVFNIVQWPVAVIGGVAASVLVPIAVKIESEQYDTLGQFRAEVLGAGLIVFGVLSAGLALLLPTFLVQPWLGLTPIQASLAAEISPTLAWTVVLSGTSQLLAVWVMARNGHLNSLFEGLPSLVILIAVLSISGMAALVWGTVFGFAVQLIFLLIYLFKRDAIEFPEFRRLSPHWRAVLTGMGAMIVGHTLSTTISILDQFYAARLGAGALSTLGYANRLLSLIMSLGALAISRALLPILSHSYQTIGKQTNRTVYQWSILLLLAGVVCLIACLWLGTDVLRLLFERGEFEAADTLSVSEVFRYSAVQIPFYFAATVCVYALLGQGRYFAVAMIGGFNLASKLILAYFLTNAMGLNGLVLSTAGVYIVSLTISLYMLNQTAK